MSFQNFILFIELCTNHHFSIPTTFTKAKMSNYKKEFTDVYMHI